MHARGVRAAQVRSAAADGWQDADRVVFAERHRKPRSDLDGKVVDEEPDKLAEVPVRIGEAGSKGWVARLQIVERSVQVGALGADLGGPAASTTQRARDSKNRHADADERTSDATQSQ